MSGCELSLFCEVHNFYCSYIVIYIIGLLHLKRPGVRNPSHTFKTKDLLQNKPNHADGPVTDFIIFSSDSRSRFSIVTRWEASVTTIPIKASP